MNGGLDIVTLLAFSRNLGILNLIAEDYNKAILCFQFEKEHLKDDDYYLMAVSYQNLSFAYKETYQLEKAIENLLKAFEARENLNLTKDFWNKEGHNPRYSISIE